MGKKRRSTTNKKQSEKSIEDNDKPNPEDESYFYDEIDKFHSEKEKILLHGNDDDSDGGMYSDQEEVLNVQGASESESEDEDDLNEVSTEEDEIPSNTAWGSKKIAFYGADTLDGLEGFDRDQAEAEEEKEALLIQERLASQLDEDDFGLDFLQNIPETEELSLETKVVNDYSGLTYQEQKKLLKKESPELKQLLKDFNDKSEDLQTEVLPLLALVKGETIPSGKAADFIETKFRLYTAYLTNIAFYLSLKAKRVNVQNHPVIGRLLEYRTLINKLAPINEKFQMEATEFLSKMDEGIDKAEESNNKNVDSSSESELENETAKIKEKEVIEEEFAKAYYESIKERIENEHKDKEPEPCENMKDVNENSRRAIDYEMQKNKGLTAKKRKIDRNPRVKHRMKYRKALIRRKGQVRDYKPELNKYGGEISGIRAGVIKGIKLK